MEKQSQLESLLESTDGTRIDSGSFTYSPEKTKKKYQNVLENPRLGLLFFVQTAERWKTPRLDIKVLKWAIELSFQIPETHRDWARKLREDPDLSMRVYPKEHPLYELSHGYLILTQGLPKAEHHLTIDSSLKNLTYRCDERAQVRFRLVSEAHTFRFLFTTQLQDRILTSVPSFVGNRPFGCPPQSAATHLAIGLSSRRYEQRRESLTKNSGAGQDLDENVTVLPGKLKEALTVIHKSELEFNVQNSTQSGSQLIPVQFGVALKPLSKSLPFTGSILFPAEGLKTDFSRLELIQNAQVEEQIQETFREMARTCAVLREQPEKYRVRLGSGEVLKDSARESLFAGLSCLNPLISAAATAGTCPTCRISRT